jgi:hypothetical protein
MIRHSSFVRHSDFVIRHFANMRLLLQIVSWLALTATALAPVLYAAGQIALPPTKVAMLLATIVWFATVPFWMGRPKVDDELVI